MSNLVGQFLPEWAPVRCVLLAWPYPHGDWQVNYSAVVECYWGILSALSEEIEVGLLLHPSLDHDKFQQDMQAKGIKSSNVNIHVIQYDDTWIRDYGPLSLSDGYISYTFNGWGGKYSAENDNQVPQALESYLTKSVRKYDFVCEGGGLETNGDVLLLNANCIVDDLRNKGLSKADVERVFEETLGLKEFAWLEDVCFTGDDTDGHIDTIARFAAPDVVVYAGPSQDHVDAPILESLHQQIQLLAERHQWKTYALPSPVYRSLIDKRVLPCTYANFLIVNKTVFVPIYGLAEDLTAIEVISEAFSSYRVVPVRCEALLEQHGSLHCATMQVALLP